MKLTVLYLIFAITSFTFEKNIINISMSTQDKQFEKATLGGGCFWCIEAAFNEIKGVKSAVSGYSGGHIPDPLYKEVSSGKTGHAEVVQISFDPSIITYEQILFIFFSIHDPTTLNRQGNDIGTQYRSIIFFHNNDQKNTAEAVISSLNTENIFNNPIVTELKPFEFFYKAEDYHQEYYENNPSEGYCSYVIKPKMDKFRKKYSHLLKSF